MRLSALFATFLTVALLPTQALAAITISANLMIDTNESTGEVTFINLTTASDDTCEGAITVEAQVLDPNNFPVAVNTVNGGCSNSAQAQYSVGWGSMLEGDYTAKGTATSSTGQETGTMCEVANTTRFRAVFQRRGPNGDKVEYGAVCTHSCQPGKVCLVDNAEWAFFEGVKIVTPFISRCSLTTPVFATTMRMDCIGSGVGLWTSYNHGCPF
jgi:hypothetical protein